MQNVFENGDNSVAAFVLSFGVSRASNPFLGGPLTRRSLSERKSRLRKVESVFDYFAPRRRYVYGNERQISFTPIVQQQQQQLPCLSLVYSVDASAISLENGMQDKALESRRKVRKIRKRKIPNPSPKKTTEDLNAWHKNGDWRGILSTINDRRHVMNAVNVACAAHRISDLVHRGVCPTEEACNHVFPVLTEIFSSIRTSFLPRELATFAFALGRVGYRNDALVKELVDQAFVCFQASGEEKQSEWTAQGIATLSQAVVRIGGYSPTLFSSIATKTVELLSTFSAQNISSVVWSFAVSDHRDTALFAAVAREVMARSLLPEFSAQELAKLVSGFARVGHGDDELLLSVAAVAIKRAEEFRQAELASLVWGFASLGYDDPQFYGAIRTIAEVDLAGYELHQLKTIRWALYRVGMISKKISAATREKACAEKHKSHRDAISKAFENGDWRGIVTVMDDRDVKPGNIAMAAHRLASLVQSQKMARDDALTIAMPAVASKFHSMPQKFSGRDLATFATACARMGYKDLHNTTVICRYVPEHVRDSTSQGLANIAYSLAKLGVQASDPAFSDIALLCTQGGLMGRLRVFKPQELAMLAWAYVIVDGPALPGSRLSALLQAVCSEATTLADDFYPREAAMLLWACARAHFKQPEMFRRIGERAIKILHSFKPQELANCCWAFAKLDIKNGRLFSATAKMATRQLASFKNNELTMLLWAFHRNGSQEEEFFRAAEAEAMARLSNCAPDDLDLAWELGMLETRVAVKDTS
mmetsp:Transcript_2709/g.4833  ORF Transcript_2709/g.4833 Transcript_2709/m.4833 type:complete len:763 (+) Transcript_2709:24-2312(+)